MTQLFFLGSIVATPGAIATLEEQGVAPRTLIDRHVSGDWLEMSADDQRSNLEAIERGSRVFSRYTLANQAIIWIITEADRSSTTILLPDEY
jgi:hypothetical protein